MAEYHIRWDPTNKKWEVSVDGGAFADLVEKPTLEQVTMNGVAAPSGIASKGVLYYDSTANRFKIKENNGAADQWCRESGYPATGLDVNGLTSEPNAPDQDSDFIPFYDASAGANRKLAPRYINSLIQSFVYSAGQYFSTTGQNLTSYDYTFAAGDLEVGDIIVVEGTVALIGSTAGTKSLTLAIGTGTPRTLFTTTLTTANTIFQFRVKLVVRSLTSIAMQGFTFWAVSDAAFAGTYTINQGQAVLSVDANSQLVRMVGTHTGSNAEALMSDYSIRLFRCGGNVTVV